MKRLLCLGLIAASLSMPAALRADDKPAAPAPADPEASLKADNKQLSDELAAAWKESADLKARLDQMTADYAAQNQKLAETKDALDKAQASPKSDSDAARQLTETQDKLDTSLRSFSVLQDENTQLKAQIDKLNSDNAALVQKLEEANGQVAALQPQAAETAQIAPLRDQVRQAQDEAARLATENAELKTRLALQPAAPSSAHPVPLRPGQPAAVAAAQPPPPPPPPPVKTYVIADGDTLTKISRKFYGSSSRWDDILKANRDVIKDENSLVVGSTIKIP